MYRSVLTFGYVTSGVISGRGMMYTSLVYTAGMIYMLLILYANLYCMYCCFLLAIKSIPNRHDIS